MHTRDFVDYCLAVAPFLGIVVAVAVGLMQYYLQREKLKLDLFDRRFAVYMGVRDFLSEAIAPPYLQTMTFTEAYLQFQKLKRPARFLFGSDVAEYFRAVANEVEWSEDKSGKTIISVRSDDDEMEMGIRMMWGANAERVFVPYICLYHHNNWWSRFAARIRRWVDYEQPELFRSRYSTSQE